MELIKNVEVINIPKAIKNKIANTLMEGEPLGKCPVGKRTLKEADLNKPIIVIPVVFTNGMGILFCDNEIILYHHNL